MVYNMAQLSARPRNLRPMGLRERESGVLGFMAKTISHPISLDLQLALAYRKNVRGGPKEKWSPISHPYLG
jgi:hypothetical protein